MRSPVSIGIGLLGLLALGACAPVSPSVEAKERSAPPSAPGATDPTASPATGGAADAPVPRSAPAPVVEPAPAPAADAVPAPGGGLRFEADPAWVAEEPESSMRVAQYRLPGEGAADATLVVYFFAGAGGSVEDNFERWLAQFEQPDGSDSRDRALVSHEVREAITLHHLEVAGTFVAEVTPGSTERRREPGWRLRAAVVETDDGPYFVKLVGPEATVQRWAPSYQGFLASMR